MTIERKVGMGIAGQPSGGATDVAEVFSTYVYAGNGTNSNVINNGIDLAGEGGMVWVKNRSSTDAGIIVDTERGIQKQLTTSSTSSENTDYRDIESFNSNGFTARYWSNATNNGDYGYASWTFRKKEKFFDVVTYTGNYVAGREISHGLAGPVGMMIIKCLSNNEDWAVYHRGANGGVTPQNFKLILNNTSAAASGYWNNTAPTDSSFTVGQSGEVNGNNQTYVAYLFADNSSELAGNQMIKCGSATTVSGNKAVVNLGWEPQFLLIKKSNSSGDWIMQDTMRGLRPDGSGNFVYANSTDAEVSQNGNSELTSTGFTAVSNGIGHKFIYMAIRAPMMKKPSAATEVFNISTYGANRNNSTTDTFYAGFPVDMALKKNPVTGNANNFVSTRMLGTSDLSTNHNGAERTGETEEVFDSNTHWNKAAGTTTTNYSWMWKRAKGYFDVVAYTGTGSARTIPHSLGVAPEMIWAKKRNNSRDWGTGFASQGWTKRGPALDQNETSYVASVLWNDTAPTDSVFSVSGLTHINGSGDTYIAYLFATLAGISKVGSYTGNGSNQTINCGFSAGSRFILIKRTDATGDWYVWDSVRGIVAGNDPHLSLNTTTAQVTSDDSIDPANAGFIVNQVSATNINVSSGTYIFYAIA